MEHDRSIVVLIRRGADLADPFACEIEVDTGGVDCHAARAYLQVAIDALNPDETDE